MKTVFTFGGLSVTRIDEYCTNVHVTNMVLFLFQITKLQYFFYKMICLSIQVLMGNGLVSLYS